MNLFEKITNHELLAQLDERDVFFTTGAERSWLKTMLEHPAAQEALSRATLLQLQTLLTEDEPLQLHESLTQKAQSRENQVFHPLIHPVREAIQNRSKLRFQPLGKYGVPGQPCLCIPYKLEYSMVKREWYLLWYKHDQRRLMSTRLDKISDCREEPCMESEWHQAQQEIRHRLELQRDSVTLEIPRQYNSELSRILYAFSCFEKQVRHDETENCYSIILHFSSNEHEYVLSRLRFLGRRVRVQDHRAMQARMHQSATMALSRYLEG